MPPSPRGGATTNIPSSGNGPLEYPRVGPAGSAPRGRVRLVCTVVFLGEVEQRRCATAGVGSGQGSSAATSKEVRDHDRLVERILQRSLRAPPPGSGDSLGRFGDPPHFWLPIWGLQVPSRAPGLSGVAVETKVSAADAQTGPRSPDIRPSSGRRLSLERPGPRLVPRDRTSDPEERSRRARRRQMMSRRFMCGRRSSPSGRGN